MHSPRSPFHGIARGLCLGKNDGPRWSKPPQLQTKVAQPQSMAKNRGTRTSAAIHEASALHQCRRADRSPSRGCTEHQNSLGESECQISSSSINQKMMLDAQVDALPFQARPFGVFRTSLMRQPTPAVTPLSGRAAIIRVRASTNLRLCVGYCCTLLSLVFFADRLSPLARSREDSRGFCPFTGMA